ncbi:hypothetical protein [Paraflavitalea pollutisoli]|uniref:hypothetical protein n=1 Tax=Paraflavitalea pollutisoli TaxID=3034143 RepID=UPI0023EDC415|nr:hypothetical protein [Paraflavitalea sp. H1-2-19X]
MLFNHAKQFWTWFSFNSEIYRHLNEMDKDLKRYWERELVTHMRAYTKRLSVVLFYPEEGESSITITALANPRYFSMAENMAAKAPALKGWKVYGLQPAGLYGEHLDKEYADTGITRASIRCLPPIWTPRANRYTVQCYANIGEEPTEKMSEAIDAMVCDQLGEKIVGTQLHWVDVYDNSEIAAGQYEQLIELDQLRKHFPELEIGNLSINCLGELKTRKK